MKRSISSGLRPRIGAILLAILALVASAASGAAVYVSVEIAPPLLPVYEQPALPGPGYIWTPGYWAWAPDGFYWVPGTWVFAPFAGALWTPGYWAWGSGLYFWHPGYWGRHVGFYGGIDYGFGYTGFGYHGGYWDHGAFRYNRTVNNVNVTNITNVYSAPVVNPQSVTRVSYSGGAGGVLAQPTRQEQIAARERHTPLLPVQVHHELAASSNRAQFAALNNGHPAVAATPRPERFAAGPAVRSFSQPAPARAASLPGSGSDAGPALRAGQRSERSAPMNRATFPSPPGAHAQSRFPSQRPPQAQSRTPGAPQPQAHPSMPQPQLRPPMPQAQLRPHAPPRAEMRPLRPPQQERAPPQPRQGMKEHPGER